MPGGYLPGPGVQEALGQLQCCQTSATPGARLSLADPEGSTERGSEDNVPRERERTQAAVPVGVCTWVVGVERKSAAVEAADN